MNKKKQHAGESVPRNPTSSPVVPPQPDEMLPVPENLLDKVPEERLEPAAPQPEPDVEIPKPPNVEW